MAPHKAVFLHFKIFTDVQKEINGLSCVKKHLKNNDLSFATIEVNILNAEKGESRLFIRVLF